MTSNYKKNLFTKKIQNLIQKKKYIEKADTNTKKKTNKSSSIKSRNNLIALNSPTEFKNFNSEKKAIYAISDSFTSSIEIENSMINKVNNVSSNYNYPDENEYKYSFEKSNKKVKSKDFEEKDVYELTNCLSFDHIPISKFKPLKQISIQNNLEEDFNYSNLNIERLQVFLKNLKFNYIKTYESYNNMLDGYNSFIQNINNLYKRVETQTEKINKVNDNLYHLNNSNIWLKNQHNTFVLYKKEINKYIEVFKESLNTKTEEIKNLYEENNRITQGNIKYECENDLLKREIENNLLKNQRLINDKKIINEELIIVRRRLNDLEKKTKEKYYKVINEMSNIYVKKIFEFEMYLRENKDIVIICKNEINKLKREIYLTQERIIKIFKKYKEKEIEFLKLKKKIELIEEEKNNNKKNNVLKLKTEINLVNKNWINKWEELKKYFKINGYNIIIENLKILNKSIETIIIHVKKINENNTKETIIKYYTDLIIKQKLIFEKKENEYLKKINNLEIKKESISDEINVWDVF